MVSLVVGFPGSGKSYYAVEKIYNLLSNEKKQEFDVIYTNIGGIKFDFFPDSQIEFKKLKEEELINYLTECFKLYEKYKSYENVDDYLIEYSKEKGFYKALIVFDECHDFFSNQDRVKIFWLTYHRHLHHELILLTQNKSLINSKYRAIPEQFIEAQPRSKKIFSNTLNYKHYASFAMKKTDLFKSSSLKTNQDIFSLYQSGNKSNQKSIILKFILILGLGLLIAVFLFLNLFNSYKEEEEVIEAPKQEEKIKTKSQSKDTRLASKEEDSSPKEEYFNILVQFESGNGYLVKDRYYQKGYFKRFLRYTGSRILIKELVYEADTYKMEKIILRTSINDLNKFFFTNEERQLQELQARNTRKQNRE